jgi:DNA-binding response OmpR family regulator
LALARGTVDFTRARFLRHDQRVEPLSRLEVGVLAYLAERANQVVSRDALLSDVWGHTDASFSRAVDTALSRLRRKLEPDPALPEMLFTVHGVGYRLLVDVPAPSGVDVAAPRRRLILADRVADLSAGYVDTPAGRVALTGQERLLIEELLRAGGAAVDGDRLARRLAISEGALRNAVLRLRGKLEAEPRRPAHLCSVPDGAYRLDARVEMPPPAAATQRDALISLTDYLGVVLGMPDCVLYLRTGEQLHQVAAFGPKRAPDGSVRSPLVQAIGEGLVGAAIAAAAPILCRDTRDDARYLRDLMPARAELAVPVRAAGVLVGAIDLEHPQPAGFADSLVDTVVSLAAIAAPAFARLHGGPDART